MCSKNSDYKYILYAMHNVSEFDDCAINKGTYIHGVDLQTCDCYACHWWNVLDKQIHCYNALV